jgi:hypothetical protein
MRSHQTTGTDMEILFLVIPFVLSVHKGEGVPRLLLAVYIPFQTVLRLGVLGTWRVKEGFFRADGGRGSVCSKP